MHEVRPQFALTLDQRTLFVTDYGASFENNRLSDMVKLHMRYAGFASGGWHACRHALATHMLENGADIRCIQAILGRSEPSTTQIYTHMAIGKLKAVHALTHPARLKCAVRLHTDAAGADRADGPNALLGALEAEAKQDQLD